MLDQEQQIQSEERLCTHCSDLSLVCSDLLWSALLQLIPFIRKLPCPGPSTITTTSSLLPVAPVLPAFEGSNLMLPSPPPPVLGLVCIIRPLPFVFSYHNHMAHKPRQVWRSMPWPCCLAFGVWTFSCDGRSTMGSYCMTCRDDISAPEASSVSTRRED